MTYAEQLDQVQKTITVIETTGQEYTMSGVTYRYADLETLYKRESRLLARIDRKNNGGRTVAEFN